MNVIFSHGTRHTTHGAFSFSSVYFGHTFNFDHRFMYRNNSILLFQLQKKSSMLFIAHQANSTVYWETMHSTFYYTLNMLSSQIRLTVLIRRSIMGFNSQTPRNQSAILKWNASVLDVHIFDNFFTSFLTSCCTS